MIFTKVVILFLITAFTLTSAQTLQELLANGDQKYKNFENQSALLIYNQANEVYPDEWEIKWRLSRAYVDIGEHMPIENSEDEEAQIKVYERALLMANEAVKLGPDRSINYVRRAISNGRIALFKGVFSVADVVNQIKADCEKAIKLGTGGKAVQGVAHYVYARTHAKISEKWAPAREVLGLGWAEWDIAIEEFKKAVELRPDFIMIYLDYAKALLREEFRNEALILLEKALTCPLIDEDDSKRIAEINTLIEDVKKEL